MRKFTFITLMMIFGMSSVSFGKSYLCIPTQGVGLGSVGSGDLIYSKENIVNKKFIVKTEGNNKKMKSVKEFGEIHFICNDKDSLKKDVGVSSTKVIKGGDFLSCRKTVPISQGGYTYQEFNFNFKYKDFNYYYMDMYLIRLGSVYSGKCEEI